MGKETIRNWDGTQQWKPDAIYHPENEEQIAALVRQACDSKKRVKVLGEALSWSDIIDVPTTASASVRVHDVTVEMKIPMR